MIFLVVEHFIYDMRTEFMSTYGMDFLRNGLLTRKGKYELLKSRDNKFYFVLKAPNGEIIATSEMYSSKQSAINGISSIKANADSDMVDYT